MVRSVKITIRNWGMYTQPFWINMPVLPTKALPCMWVLQLKTAKLSVFSGISERLYVCGNSCVIRIFFTLEVWNLPKLFRTQRHWIKARVNQDLRKSHLTNFSINFHIHMFLRLADNFLWDLCMRRQVKATFTKGIKKNKIPILNS